VNGAESVQTKTGQPNQPAERKRTVTNQNQQRAQQNKRGNQQPRTNGNKRNNQQSPVIKQQN